MSSWIEAMWADLDGMDNHLDRFVACGEWITIMQQTLVPELSVRRRLELVKACEDQDNDYLRVAESIGSRKATVERLANEGRAHLRELQVQLPA